MSANPSKPLLLYCKYCGALDHVAGFACPRVTTKHGSQDKPGSGPWTWFVFPEYATWHSTIKARTEDAKLLGLDGNGVVRGYLGTRKE